MVAILTIAVGIGTNTTVFSWLDSVLLRPISGVAEPGRLVAIETRTPDGSFVPNSYPDYIDYRDHLKLFDGVAVTKPAAFAVGEPEHTQRVWGELVSGNFFAVLGAKAALGRTFLPSEYGDKPGAFPVAVISDRFWKSQFGADPSIAGKTIRVNQHQLTIVGVAAPDFRGTVPGEAYDLWIPYMMQPQLNGVAEWMLRDRGDRNMLGIARLKPGASFAQAQEEISALTALMAKLDADMDAGLSAVLFPISQSHFGPQSVLQAPLKVLIGACGLLLLIVCANVANLLLARATVRQREFSTRLAMGAGRMRLARLVLTETLLLAIGGSLAGIAATVWMSGSLRYLLPAGQTWPFAEPQLNTHVLGFAILLCALTTVLAGLFPAMQCGNAPLAQGMNEGGRSGLSGAHSHRVRSALVAAEVSLALVALIGAGLFVRGFQATSKIHPGFDPSQVTLSQFYLSTNGYSLEQRKQFCRRLEDKVLSAPGVTDVAYSDGVPLGLEPSWWEHLEIEGYSPARSENMKIFRNVVSPGYLGLMHIPLLDGRDFSAHDDESSASVMIVNQSFVNRFFAGRNPIGRRVHGWGKWFVIVGVAQDSKYHYLGESPLPYFYVPFRQIYRADMALAFYVRTARGNDALSLVREKVREIDPNVAVFDSAPLAEFIGASLFPQKMAASLLTVLGTLAVILAGVGLYSVMAYSVAQRTQEIGIRIALGALPGNISRLVVRQGMGLASIGLLAGIGLSLAAARGLAAVSFAGSAMGNTGKLLGGSATDPAIYLVATLFLAAIAALAAYIPARKAARTEPMVALRHQ